MFSKIRVRKNFKLKLSCQVQENIIFQYSKQPKKLLM